MQSTPPTVLVLNEEGAVLPVFTELADWEEIRLEVHQSTVDALERIRSTRPAVVVVCVRGADKSGLDLLRAIRQDTESNATSLLVASENLSRDKVIEAFEAGSDDCVSGQLHVLELRARLVSLIRKENVRVEILRRQEELEETNNQLAAHRQELERLMERVVEALEQVNLANDNDTGNHIQRVSSYSTLLARSFGCRKALVEQIQRWASLHDVGKVGIRDAILRKPGRLTPEEFEEMKGHTRIGFELLQRAGVPEVACNIALYHHERWDGTGYPRSLHSTNIPLEARIVSVADVYDAISHKRCYRDAQSHDAARAELIRCRGTQFDPELIDAFFVDDAALQAITERWG